MGYHGILWVILSAHSLIILVIFLCPISLGWVSLELTLSSPLFSRVSIVHPPILSMIGHPIHYIEWKSGLFRIVFPALYFSFCGQGSGPNSCKRGISFNVQICCMEYMYLRVRFIWCSLLLHPFLSSSPTISSFHCSLFLTTQSTL